MVMVYVNGGLFNFSSHEGNLQPLSQQFINRVFSCV